MSRPIVLLTDFGLQDAYVGLMKGVLLSRCPDAPLIDLTHGVPPQDVRAGALLLRHALAYFPPDSVFLAVVDPGVGGERRPLCARSGRRIFVGPDNGLLWPAATERGRPEFFHLDRAELWLPERSATFHGRDVFAPVAALLAGGAQPSQCGSPISDPVRLALPAPRRTEDGLQGEVLLVDHYGNAVTNIRPQDVRAEGALYFRAGDSELGPPASHYGAVQPGQPLVVLGSMGYYEVAVRSASAAKDLALQVGQAIHVRFEPHIS
jgi:hypothetical protein